LYGKNKTGILVILDGFGIAADNRFNAVTQASTPNLDKFYENHAHTTLQASENHVGLPRGFMGNSEVGHLNIGAGRIVYQDFSLISKAIEEETFFKNEIFLDLLEKIKTDKSALHLMGLVSDGGVHSHISHLYALLKLAKDYNVSKCYIHVFTDGRDTSPTSGKGFVEKLQKYLKETKYGEIATICGRFYAMDRDSRWDRTEEAFNAIALSSCQNRFLDGVQYIEEQYQKDITDEFIEPAVNRNYKGVAPKDGVIFFNFRADRARQITRAFTQNDFTFFARKTKPELSGFVMMTPYDDSFDLPFAYSKPKVSQTLGEVVSKQEWEQLRIAETEKYAHVTYFFNGGEEKVFEGERRILVPSPREVKTYDLKPQMSAEELTDSLIKELKDNDYGLVVVNFANPDMVGHTGNLRAAISAVETIDDCLGKISDWVEKSKAFMIVTADHGNCETMLDASGEPMTAHTLNPVPFILVDYENKHELKTEGKLCDIAPTILELFNISKPKEMTGQSLLK
jgi:2,3-bisphosphoglycerate-independent phosphoglycerate mutase